MTSPSDKPDWVQEPIPRRTNSCAQLRQRTTGEPTARLFDRIASGFWSAKREVRRFPIGCGDQVYRHQQQAGKDQRVDDRDRDDANGKAAVAIVKVGPE